MITKTDCMSILVRLENQGINIDCDISIPLNISNTKKLIITASNNTINSKIV